MIDHNVPNLYGLPEFTHGEYFFLAKQSVRLDDDPLEPRRPTYMPQRLPPKLKMMYYKAKLTAVFAELGYFEPDDVWAISERYKDVRHHVMAELTAIHAARRWYLASKAKDKRC